MNLQNTVAKILNKESVTKEEAKEFALRQFGVLATYLRENPPKAELKNMAFVVSDEEFVKLAVQFGQLFTDEQKNGRYQNTYMVIRKTIQGNKLNQILFVKHLENETLEDCVKRLHLNR